MLANRTKIIRSLLFVLFVFFTQCFLLLPTHAQTPGSGPTTRLGGENVLASMREDQEQAVERQNQFTERGNYAAKELYCSTQQIITGNVGTIIGLGVALVGLYFMMVAGATTSGFIMLIAGVALTATPGLIMSFANGMYSVYSKMAHGNSGSIGKLNCSALGEAPVIVAIENPGYTGQYSGGTDLSPDMPGLGDGYGSTGPETGEGVSLGDMDGDGYEWGELYERNREALANEEVINQLRDVLKREENGYGQVHMDGDGIPTVGDGHALGYSDSSGKPVLRSLDSINSELGKAGLPTMSAADYNALQSAISNGQKSGVIKNANYTLDQSQKDKLLGYDIEKRVDSLAKAAAENGVDMSGANSGTIVTVSEQYYRGGTNLVMGSQSPKITNALKNGQLGTAAAEIMYNSNAEGLRGVDSRNMRSVQRMLSDLSPSDQAIAKQQINDWIRANPDKYNAAAQRMGSSGATLGI